MNTAQKPTEAQLLQSYEQHQRQLAYYRDYAKKRREDKNTVKQVQANSRAYYWNHREEILERRKALRDNRQGMVANDIKA
jgi:hypothetical protein